MGSVDCERLDVLVRSVRNDPYCNYLLYYSILGQWSLRDVQNGTHLELESKLSACLFWDALC